VLRRTIEIAVLIGHHWTLRNPSYSHGVNPSAPSIQVFPSQTGLQAVGIFLFFGAVMASLAGITLVWRGTALDRIWTLNPRAYNELAPLGKPIGFLFLFLAVSLVLASAGWLKRRRWGWQLAVAIIGTQVLGDVTNIFYGRIIQGAVGATIAGALLFYMTRQSIRACFVKMPKQIVHSQYP
jgi:hypothetical protein